MHRSSVAPGVAQLRVLSDDTRPDAASLAVLLDEVRADPTITTIRTSALFPTAATRFAELGFVGASTLALLRLDLRGETVPALAAPAAQHTVRRGGERWSTRNARRREFPALAEIDAAAFGPGWSHDAGELRQICAATPVHRVRVRCIGHPVPWVRRRLAAFAVAGATATHGYLQRLSVNPAAHRRGHGAALTLDALHWMRRRRLDDCLVNTSVDNVAALGLYERLGFVRLADVLQVMELDLTAPGTR